MHPAVRNVVVALLSVTALASQPPDTPKKQPWEWTDDERIAMLMDERAAAKRIGEAIASGKVKLGKGPRPKGLGLPIDSISGSRDPHLFMPHELFDSLIRTVFAEDAETREAWQGAKEAARLEAGLPDDVWDRLEQIAAAYIHARRREYEIAASTIPEPQKWALMEPVSMERCREAYYARIAADAEFGPAFRKFLYISARSHGVLTFERDAESIRRLSRGCQ